MRKWNTPTPLTGAEINEINHPITKTRQAELDRTRCPRLAEMAVPIQRNSHRSRRKSRKCASACQSDPVDLGNRFAFDDHHTSSGWRAHHLPVVGLEFPRSQDRSCCLCHGVFHYTGALGLGAAASAGSIHKVLMLKNSRTGRDGFKGEEVFLPARARNAALLAASSKWYMRALPEIYSLLQSSTAQAGLGSCRGDDILTGKTLLACGYVED